MKPQHTKLASVDFAVSTDRQEELVVEIPSTPSTSSKQTKPAAAQVYRI